MRGRRVLAVGLPALLATVGVPLLAVAADTVGAPLAGAAVESATVTKTFSTAGDYTFTVPANAGNVTFVARGGGTAARVDGYTQEHYGAEVSGTASGLAGQTLRITVGSRGGYRWPAQYGGGGAGGSGRGGFAAAFFYGAAGAGASYVSVGSGTPTPSSVLLVGGGAGGSAIGQYEGGDADADGESNASVGSYAGKKGTATAGGAGGGTDAFRGSDGSFLQGGSGGSGDDQGGSGGGGGYYGGGGGSSRYGYGGAGGGGSSYLKSTLTSTSGPTLTTAASSVTVSYTAAKPTVTLTTYLSGSDTNPLVTFGSSASVQFQCLAGVGGSGVADGGSISSCVSNTGDSVAGGLLGSFPLNTSSVGTKTYTVTATASDGLVTTSSFTYTVVDKTPPFFVLTLDNGSNYSEAVSASGAPKAWTIVGRDDVDGVVPASCDRVSGSTFPIGDTHVNCTTRDAAGNFRTTSFMVTVGDNTPPTISPVSDITVDATSGQGATVTYTTPTATDLVDPNPSVSCSPLSGSVFALGTTTVTCSAKDSSNRRASTSFKVKVVDGVPVLVVPSDVTLEASGPDGAVASLVVSATDAVDGVLPVSCDHGITNAQFGLGDTKVSCSATDSAGNVTSSSFKVSVKDTLAPAVEQFDSFTFEASGPDGFNPRLDAPGYFDAVSGRGRSSCDHSLGEVFPVGVTTVKCSATDGAGNTGSSSFLVTVVDTTAPVIDQPSDVTVEATSADGAVALFSTPVAHDVVSGSTSVSCTPVSNLLFPVGDSTVSCTSSDDAGNTGSVSFKVQVVDTTAPVLSVGSSVVTGEATGPSGAAVSFESPTAQDVVSGSTGVSCDRASGSVFALGDTTVTCTSVDAAGNTGTVSFTVRVVDTTGPVITATDQVFEATSAAGAAANYQRATATDAVDGAVAVSCVAAPGSVFALGVNTVSCEAKDAAGNVSSASFDVMVRDTTAPVVTVPSGVTVEATGALTAVSFTTSASDVVSGSTAVSCDPVSGSVFPVGLTTVTCTSTDGANNTGTASFTVKVVDTTAPVVGQVDDIVAEATSAAGAAVSFTAPGALDTVSGATAVSCDRVSGSTFPVGTTTVICSSTDAARNTGSVSFKVTVRDTTGPVLAVTGGPVAGASYAFGSVPAQGACAASDVVSGVTAAGCVATGYSTLVGSHTLSFTATDGRGNTTVQTRGYSVYPIVAGAPSGLVATPGEKSATVKWVAPAATGGVAIDSYVVTLTLGNQAVTKTVPASTLTASFTGLVAGGNYVVSVVARNAAGDSPAAVGSVIPTAAATLSGAAPGTVAGAPYSYSYTVGGFPAPVVSFTGGVLPAGLSLSTAGVLSGTATVAGTYSFTVTAANSTGSVSLPQTIVVTPAVPASITIVSGNNQSQTATAGFASPLKAVVRDTYGNPIANTAVVFAVASGPASLSASTVTVQTDASGIATLSGLVAGSSGGSVQVTAKVVSKPAVTVTFSELVLWSWQARSDLSVSITTPASVSVSGTYTITYTITNSGPNAAVGVTGSYTPPAGSTPISVTGPTLWANAGGAYWQTGVVLEGTSVSYTITLRAPAYGMTASHYGSVNTSTIEPNYQNNTTMTPTRVG